MGSFATRFWIARNDCGLLRIGQSSQRRYAVLKLWILWNLVQAEDVEGVVLAGQVEVVAGDLGGMVVWFVGVDVGGGFSCLLVVDGNVGLFAIEDIPYYEPTVIFCKTF